MGVEVEVDAGPAKENKGFCSELEAAAEGAEAVVDSAGLGGAPKLRPGLLPKRPPVVADVPEVVDEGSAGLPKPNVFDFVVSSAGLAPNRPEPPVLAPKVDPDGGGPAGVVEALPKLKRLLLPVVAGVTEPNRGAAEVVVDGVGPLSGVPNPEKTGFEPSLF